MFIKNTITYIKHKKIIDAILKEEDLLNNLSKIFGVRFKKDWVGRIYAVINPVAQSDPNARIFEYDNNGTNIKSFVEKFIMERMIAADNFIKNHQLFDILLYDIKKLDEDYNYLFVLTPIAWIDFWKSLKRVFWVTIGLLITAITLIIIF